MAHFYSLKHIFMPQISVNVACPLPCHPLPWVISYIFFFFIVLCSGLYYSKEQQFGLTPPFGQQSTFTLQEAFTQNFLSEIQSRDTESLSEPSLTRVKAIKSNVILREKRTWPLYDRESAIRGVLSAMKHVMQRGKYFGKLTLRSMRMRFTPGSAPSSLLFIWSFLYKQWIT